MHSFIVRYLINNKVQVETITSNSPSEARREILSKYKGALILSIRCIDYDNDSRIY